MENKFIRTQFRVPPNRVVYFSFLSFFFDSFGTYFAFAATAYGRTYFDGCIISGNGHQLHYCDRKSTVNEQRKTSAGVANIIIMRCTSYMD